MTLSIGSWHKLLILLYVAALPPAAAAKTTAIALALGLC
jgi:hypothetical protein